MLLPTQALVVHEHDQSPPLFPAAPEAHECVPLRGRLFPAQQGAGFRRPFLYRRGSLLRAPVRHRSLKILDDLLEGANR